MAVLPGQKFEQHASPQFINRCLFRPAMKRIPQLDGLRGIAILGVLAFHLIPGQEHLQGMLPAIIRRCIALGQTGVDLFFVLSGFLITGILIDSRDQPRRWSTFIARRSFRIFPLYFITLTVIFWLLPDFLGLRTLSHYQLWAWGYASNIGHTFGLCPDFGHFWSLAVEEQFYLVWPFCVWRMRNTNGVVWLCVGTIVLAIGSRIIGLSADVFPAAFTLCRIDALAMGGLIACFVRLQNDHARLAYRCRNVFCISLAAAAPMYIAGSGSGAGWQQVVKFSLFGCVYASLLGFAVTSRSSCLMNRVLSHAALRWFGTYSYCLYLVHPFLMTAMERWLPNGSAALQCFQVAGTVAGSMLLAKISWILIEQPIMNAKDRWFPGHSVPKTDAMNASETR